MAAKEDGESYGDFTTCFYGMVVLSASPITREG